MSATAWYTLPLDDDGPIPRSAPPCGDGDEILCRVDGEVILCTVDRRHGVWFIGPDGETVTPDAIARPPKASGRTFTEAERLASYERTERLSLRLRPGTVAALRARAESADLSLAELVETLGLR